MAYLDENGLEHFWGKIKDHVDSAVAPKANDADVVHKTTDQTIDGNKTFNNEIRVVRSAPASHFQAITGINESGKFCNVSSLSTSVESNFYWFTRVFPFGNANNLQLAQLILTKPNEEFTSIIELGKDLNGIKYASTERTSLVRTVGSDIVTRSYVIIGDVYVDPVNGNDSNEGTSASAAFKTIGTVINKVSHMPRCGIVLAAGTYTENIDFHTCRNFIFKPSGNVVINGYLHFRRNSFLHIYPSASNVTFTAKDLIVEQNSYLLCDCKFISNNTGIICSDESIAVFNQGLEVIANSGANTDGITVSNNSSVHISKEITLHNGSVANSNIGTAIRISNNSTVGVSNCTTNITCVDAVFSIENNSVAIVYNSSYSDSTNVFTATSSTRNLITMMSSAVMRLENVKMALIATRDENNGSNTIVSINDSSSIRSRNSQFNINCTGKAYAFIIIYGHSSIVFESGSLVLNGATYARTVNCYNHGFLRIGNSVSVSGTVTGGSRFLVYRGGQIDIGGHSAGLNRIPGGSAGVVEASSYGYYG